MYGQPPGIRVTSHVILCRPPQLPERHNNVMQDWRNNKSTEIILNQHTYCFWSEVGSSVKIQKTRCIHLHIHIFETNIYRSKGSRN